MSMGPSTRLKCNRGTTAVEFALLFGPLLMMTFGICEYGRMFWTEEGLQETAIAGARCIGMLSTNCAASGAFSSTSAMTFIKTEAQKWAITLPSSGITMNVSTTCGGVSGFSQVSLTYSFQSIMPQFLNLNPTGTTLTASSCFPSA